MKATKLTDFDRGYWNAVQNVVSFDLRSDKQTAENLIKHGGFDRDKCLACIMSDPFQSEVLMDIINTLYPNKRMR